MQHRVIFSAVLKFLVDFFIHLFLLKALIVGTCLNRLEQRGVSNEYPRSTVSGQNIRKNGTSANPSFTIRPITIPYFD